MVQKKKKPLHPPTRQEGLPLFPGWLLTTTAQWFINECSFHYTFQSEQQTDSEQVSLLILRSPGSAGTPFQARFTHTCAPMKSEFDLYERQSEGLRKIFGFGKGLFILSSTR
jgi:hypothetical protein